MSTEQRRNSSRRNASNRGDQTGQNNGSSMGTKPAGSAPDHVDTSGSISASAVEVGTRGQTVNGRTRIDEATSEKQFTRKVALCSLVFSILSVGIAWMSYHEARETRLDALRTQIRSEALQQLANARTSFAVFNCYATIRGLDNLPGKQSTQALMDSMEPKVRAGLNHLANSDESGLLIFQHALTETAGQQMRMLQEALLKARVTWSKPDLEKADEACKVESLH